MRRSGGQQIDDLLNGLVGAVVGGFELAGGLVMGVGAVMEAAVGERAAEPFVEEQKEQRDLNPFGGEPVGVAGAVTLQQTVAFELAQVVGGLVGGVGGGGVVGGGGDGAGGLRRSAWEPAKRAVMVWKRSRTASRWSSPFLRLKSARVLETSSLLRKVADFLYCLR